MWVSGILIGISIVGSMIYSAVAMNGAFTALGSSGIGDPDALSQHIGQVLISSAIGAILFLLGLVGFIICLVNYLRLGKGEGGKRTASL